MVLQSQESHLTALGTGVWFLSPRLSIKYAVVFHGRRRRKEVHM